MGLKGGIWASRLGFRSQGWYLGLEVRIWASRLKFEGWGFDEGEGGEISLMHRSSTSIALELYHWCYFPILLINAIYI